MRSYAPQRVVDALEVALEDRVGGHALSEANPAAHKDTAKLKVRGGDGPYWSGDHFDGNATELARVVDALTHIPADDRRVWREVTVALCDWYMGDARGRALVDAWAAGSTFEGIAFSGCPEKFDPAAQDLLWREAIGCAEFSVATVFHHARTLGRWNTSRARWGLAGLSGASDVAARRAWRASCGAEDAAPAHELGALRLALPSATCHQATRLTRGGLRHFELHQSCQRHSISQARDDCEGTPLGTRRPRRGI